MAVHQPILLSPEKEQERREIARQVQDYLQRGGKIQQLRAPGDVPRRTQQANLGSSLELW